MAWNRHLIVQTIFLALTTLAAGPGGAPAAVALASGQERPRTVWSGVYTDAQAERGRSLYKESCSYCHLDSLVGFGGDAGAAAALTGARFFVRWDGENLGEMFEIISKTMPENAAGSLPAQAYVDIMSYVFKVNRMPVGGQELRPDKDELAGIRFTGTPTP